MPRQQHNFAKFKCREPFCAKVAYSDKINGQRTANEIVASNCDGRLLKTNKLMSVFLSLIFFYFFKENLRMC